MPKYIPNSRFSDCYASVGNITFFHRGGECYFRTNANPTFTGTAGQQVQLSIHQRGLREWRNLNHSLPSRSYTWSTHPQPSRKIQELYWHQDKRSLRSFTIHDYRTVFGLDLNEYQVHLRHLLIDSNSGHRSKETPLSIGIRI